MASTALPFFLIILIVHFCSLSFISATHVNSAHVYDSDPFHTTEESNSESQDLKIVPGVTKHLLVKLKGQEEEVTFDFKPDKSDPSLFEVLVLVNHKVEASHIAHFLKPETLTVNLEYQTGQCIISGDHGFNLKSPIQEDHYEIEISHDRPSEISTEDQVLSFFDQGSNSMVLLGATAGCFGFVILVVKIGSVIKKRRRSVILGHLPGKTIDTEEMNFAGYVGTVGELVSAKPNKPYQKKINTQASTASTLHCVSQNGDCKGTSIGHIKMTEEEIFDLSGNKIIQSPLKTKKMPLKGRIFDEDKSNKKNELALDLDSESERGSSRVPTMKDLRALIEKMEAEGTIGYDCDPSAESDNDEDQYEAPELPNYFCCMLCFKGTRSTISHPCRHVFACKECIEELMISYKICVLCASTITGFEPL